MPLYLPFSCRAECINRGGEDYGTFHVWIWLTQRWRCHSSRITKIDALQTRTRISDCQETCAGCSRCLNVCEEQHDGWESINADISARSTHLLVEMTEFIRRQRDAPSEGRRSRSETSRGRRTTNRSGRDDDSPNVTHVLQLKMVGVVRPLDRYGFFFLMAFADN